MSAISSSCKDLSCREVDQTIAGPETTKEELEYLQATPAFAKLTSPNSGETALHLAVQRNVLVALSSILEYEQYAGPSESKLAQLVYSCLWKVVS